MSQCLHKYEQWVLRMQSLLFVSTETKRKRKFYYSFDLSNNSVSVTLSDILIFFTDFKLFIYIWLIIVKSNIKGDFVPK